jgi:hypothetical protein
MVCIGYFSRKPLTFSSSGFIMADKGILRAVFVCKL